MNLAEYLKREGITAGALAKRIGVNRQLVYRWAAGGGLPSGKNLRRLLEATGGAVTLDALLAAQASPSRCRSPSAPATSASRSFSRCIGCPACSTSPSSSTAPVGAPLAVALGGNWPSPASFAELRQLLDQARDLIDRAERMEAGSVNAKGEIASFERTP